MCDRESSLDSSMLRILETCLAVVLATIITRISDIIGYHINYYYHRAPYNSEDLSEELTQ